MAKDAPNSHPTVSSGYLDQSRRPLPILLFLLPLIISYEIGSIVFASGVAPAAEQTIGSLFGVFGVFGVHLPSIALVTFLLTHHMIRHDPWRLHASSLGLMLGESVVWVLPLIVLSRALEFGALADAADGGLALGLGARLTLAAGAGLFEETLYRLILITVLHMVAVDVLKLSKRVGWVVSILGSAVVFALIHGVPAELAQDAGLVRLFYFAAATYFGVLFAWRGLGIVVATHVLYDITALA